MNEDRVIGAGKELVGKGERGIGAAIGNDRLQADGIVDQISGAVQNSFGQITDAISNVVDATPVLAADAADQARRLVRRADDALYDTLGENRHVYVMAGAVALLAVAILYAGRER